MTRDEATRLLQAYRPGERDANDPIFAKALALMRTDPELAAWFEREQAHAAAIRAKVRAIQPPPGLRDAILRAIEMESAPPRVRIWWRSPRWLAAAAVFAVLLSAAAWWRFAPVPGATLDEFAINFVVRRFFLQTRSPELAELKDWLAAKGAPLPQRLPEKFTQLHALGCRTLIYDDRVVSLVCFEHDGKEFHVFVARREDLSLPNADSTPRIFERRGHIAATWSDATNHYVLVSDAPSDAVRRLL